MMNQLKDFLLRDAGDENESGRAVYVLRVGILGECVYFILFAVILLLFGRWLDSLLPLACCAVSLLLMYFTYHRQDRRHHTSHCLGAFYGITTMWIITTVILFGWDCGIQHLLFVLLLFVFTTSYRSIKIKVILGLIIYGLRLGLYFYTTRMLPFFPLSMKLNHALQLLNTTTVYLLLILIMSVFAGDTLRAEGKLAMANQKLNALADTDPLTKLPNRRHALKYIGECVHNSSTPICPTVAIGDIDFFKKVNDTYGHEAGDRVLEILADLFHKTMEPYGLCARWGGEEFLFFFEHLNMDNAKIVLFELLDKIRVTVIPFGDQSIHVTMTFGMNDAVLRAQTPEEIMRQVDQIIMKADEMLYLGKQNGRNQIVG